MALIRGRPDELELIRSSGSDGSDGSDGPYAALAGLLAALQAPAARGEAAAAPDGPLLRAMAEVARSRQAHSPWNRLRMLATTASAKLLIVAAVVLGGTAVAAAAGSLPAPLQHIVDRSFAAVGVRIGPGRPSAVSRPAKRGKRAVGVGTLAPGSEAGTTGSGSSRALSEQRGRQGSGPGQAAGVGPAGRGQRHQGEGRARSRAGRGGNKGRAGKGRAGKGRGAKGRADKGRADKGRGAKGRGHHHHGDAQETNPGQGGHIGRDTRHATGRHRGTLETTRGPERSHGSPPPGARRPGPGAYRPEPGPWSSAPGAWRPGPLAPGAPTARNPPRCHRLPLGTRHDSRFGVNAS